MVKRIVIYGWIIPVDKLLGPGSGTLVDLVYFVDDEVNISDVIRIIQRAGCKIIPKRFGNRRDAPVEQDKVSVDDWDDHITVGSERVSEQPVTTNPSDYGGQGVDRYNMPMGG
jgi:hypothetical protein